MDTQKHREIWRPQGDSNPCYRRERANFNVDSISVYSRVWTFCGRFVAILLLICALPAKADGLFLEVGKSSYERPPCALWHQECAGYETHWHTRPTMFRAGFEHKYIRLSYADLGTYRIDANASDEEGKVMACRCEVLGTNHWYHVTGSMRAVLLTAKVDYNGFFMEAGPGYFRQSFKLEKDDGVYHNETLYGLGSLYGLGYEYKNYSIGFYMYNTDIGANFAHGEFPAGTGGSKVIAVGYKF